MRFPSASHGTAPSCFFSNLSIQRDMTPPFTEAIAHLQQVDANMAALIAQIGPCKLEPREGTLLDSLTRAIASQQLSTQAAAAIHGRFLTLYPDGPPTAAQLLATEDDTLRSVGLSRPKIRYLKDLAQHIEAGLPELEALAQLSDGEIIKILTQVKGIGQWTVEMLLIFRLQRPNVLPVDDLGIRKAMQRLFELDELPKRTAMIELARPWEPYRTVACWYLWRSLDL